MRKSIVRMILFVILCNVSDIYSTKTISCNKKPDGDRKLTLYIVSKLTKIILYNILIVEAWVKLPIFACFDIRILL